MSASIPSVLNGVRLRLCSISGPSSSHPTLQFFAALNRLDTPEVILETNVTELSAADATFAPRIGREYTWDGIPPSKFHAGVVRTFIVSELRSYIAAVRHVRPTT